MTQPLCPQHNCSKLVPGGISKAGKPYKPFWSCELQSCTAGRNGKKWSQDAEDAPAAPPAVAGAPAAEAASPRLAAASTALLAACTRYAGTPTPTNMVMQEARIYLEEFLKPAFKNELPESFLTDPKNVDADIPF